MADMSTTFHVTVPYEELRPTCTCGWVDDKTYGDWAEAVEAGERHRREKNA